jgi:hypothetical protein
MATVNASSTNKTKRFYNPTGVASAFTSTHGYNFTCDERRTGSRGMLRHDEHLTDYSSTRTTGGLHAMYVALRNIQGSSLEEKKEVDALVTGTMNDLFDIVSHLFIYFAQYLM